MKMRCQSIFSQDFFSFGEKIIAEGAALYNEKSSGFPKLLHILLWMGLSKLRIQSAHESAKSRRKNPPKSKIIKRQIFFIKLKNAV